MNPEWLADSYPVRTRQPQTHTRLVLAISGLDPSLLETSTCRREVSSEIFFIFFLPPFKAKRRKHVCWKTLKKGRNEIALNFESLLRLGDNSVLIWRNLYWILHKRIFLSPLYDNNNKRKPRGVRRKAYRTRFTSGRARVWSPLAADQVWSPYPSLPRLKSQER